MTPRDYTKLDETIVDAIKRGNTHAREIILTCQFPDDVKFNDADRVLDKRLQALRRQGLITYTGQKSGWKIAEKSA